MRGLVFVGCSTATGVQGASAEPKVHVEIVWSPTKSGVAMHIPFLQNVVSLFALLWNKQMHIYKVIIGSQRKRARVPLCGSFRGTRLSLPYLKKSKPQHGVEEAPSGHLKLCHSRILGEAATPLGKSSCGSFEGKPAQLPCLEGREWRVPCL